jgi:hypothetical protein
MRSSSSSLSRRAAVARELPFKRGRRRVPQQRETALMQVQLRKRSPQPNRMMALSQKQQQQSQRLPQLNRISVRSQVQMVMQPETWSQMQRLKGARSKILQLGQMRVWKGMVHMQMPLQMGKCQMVSRTRLQQGNSRRGVRVVKRHQQLLQMRTALLQMLSQRSSSKRRRWQ